MHLKCENLKSTQFDDYVSVGKIMFPTEDWANGKIRIYEMLVKWPHGIFVVRDKHDEIVAYSTLWPLETKACSDLQNGILPDSGMNSNKILAPNITVIDDWLLGAIAVTPETSGVKRKLCIELLVRNIDRIIHEYSGRRIFAHAATTEGRRFLERNRFEFSFKADPSLGVRIISGRLEAQHRVNL
jgi:hypothetical protein